MSYYNTCYNCKKKFEVDRPSNQDPNNGKKFIKYCSKTCRSEGHSKNTTGRKSKRPKKELPVYINTCHLCKKKFQVYSKRQNNQNDKSSFKKYCSKECVARNQSLRIKEKVASGSYSATGEKLRRSSEIKRIERTGFTVDDVITLYVETDISINELSDKTGWTRSLISEELDKREITKNNHSKEKQDKIDIAVEEYMNNENITLQALEDKYDITRLTISKHLKKMKVAIRNPLRKYTYNENYFEIIDTEDKAYWLGFLAADGAINEHKHYKTVELGLAAVDTSHLEKFVVSIDGEKEMVKNRITKSKGKEYPSCRVTVNCTKMANDLIDKGITPRKSHTLQFPTFLPDSLIKHFMRGYFDGDGGVQVRNGTTLAINILGNEDFLTDYLKKLSQLLGVPIQKMYSKSTSNVKTIYYYGKNAAKILDFFYGNAFVYLDRKYDKFYKLKKAIKEKEEEKSVQLNLFK